MTNKSKVKVLKKNEAREVPSKPDSTKSTRLAAREMVSTVTDWVAEFKSRKSEETKVAIEQFFSARPQPSEL